MSEEFTDYGTAQSFQVQIDCIGYGILDYARLKQYLMHTWEKQEQFEQDLDAYLCSCCTRKGYNALAGRTAEDAEMTFEDIDPKEIQDVEKLKIDVKSKPEKVRKSWSPGKNPYFLKYKGITIKIGFASTNRTIEEAMQSLVQMKW
ncbi:MAG: DUF6870 family protein [Blautia faecis]